MAEKASRNTQTRFKIKQAFTELVSEKGFGALTVSDITRRAKINRGTFYLHFTDKNDLLEQLEEETIKDLASILLAPQQNPSDIESDSIFPFSVLRDALSYVVKDYAFISTIAGNGGDPQFSEKFKRLIEGLFDQGLTRSKISITGNEIYPASYAREIALSHVMAIIDLWMRRGCTETPNQVAHMICETRNISFANLVTTTSI